MTKNKLVFFTLVLGILFCSCDSHKSNWEGAEKIFLHGVELPVKSLVQPYRVAVSAQRKIIFLIDMGKDRQVLVYGLEDGKLIKSFLERGEGLGKAMNATSLQLLGDNRIAIYGALEKSILIYNIDSLLSNNSVNEEKRILLSESIVSSPLMLENNRIVDRRVNLKRDSLRKLNFYDSEGKLTRVSGVFPSEYQDLTPFHISEMYNSFINVNEDKIVLAHAFTDLIEIYNANGELLISKEGPDNFEPILQPIVKDGGTMIAQNEKTVRGYSFVNLGSNEILAIYNGTPSLETPDNKSQLILMDLNGNFLTRMILDIPIFHFDVDWSSRYIYGLNNNKSGKFSIVKFKF